MLLRMICYNLVRVIWMWAITMVSVILSPLLATEAVCKYSLPLITCSFLSLPSVQTSRWTWARWTWRSSRWRTSRRSWRSGASRVKAAQRSLTSSVKSQSSCPSTLRRPPRHGQTSEEDTSHTRRQQLCTASGQHHYLERRNTFSLVHGCLK